MTVDSYDKVLDDLYHNRDIAYDIEDYDTVRNINQELSTLMNVDEVDDLDDYDEQDYLANADDDEYFFEER